MCLNEWPAMWTLFESWLLERCGQNMTIMEWVTKEECLLESWLALGLTCIQSLFVSGMFEGCYVLTYLVLTASQRGQVPSSLCGMERGNYLPKKTQLLSRGGRIWTQAHHSTFSYFHHHNVLLPGLVMWSNTSLILFIDIWRYHSYFSPG